MRVVVTGARGAVGRHVADRLGAHDEITEIVGIDRQPGRFIVELDLLTGNLSEVLQQGDVVVHLASWPSGFAGDAAAARNDLAMATRLLDAAREAGCGHVVLVSTAMVYGAWPDNPVPLSETAPIRPNPEFRFGTVRAEIEQLGTAWAESTDGTVSIVRPCTTMARGRENGLANLLRHSAALRNTEGDAPMQFLHAEDFATAIETIVVGGHGGVFNVAPDGWLRAAEVAALRGTPDTPLRAPGFVISAVSEGRRRFGASTHPGLTPYLQHPWVIANDKLRALGWEPEFSNDEAYVVGHRPGPLDGVTSKRRQELALGVAGAGLVAGGLSVAAVIRWLVRR